MRKEQPKYDALLLHVCDDPLLSNTFIILADQVRSQAERAEPRGAHLWRFGVPFAREFWTAGGSLNEFRQGSKKSMSFSVGSFYLIGGVTFVLGFGNTSVFLRICEAIPSSKAQTYHTLLMVEMFDSQRNPTNSIRTCLVIRDLTLATCSRGTEKLAYEPRSIILVFDHSTSTCNQQSHVW